MRSAAPIEQEAAEYIEKEFNKPVASLIAGATAPTGKRMGHAGAIITGASATAEEKTRALKKAGAHIIPSPAEIAPPLWQLRHREHAVTLTPISGEPIINGQEGEGFATMGPRREGNRIQVT